MGDKVGYFPRVGPKKRGWFRRQLARAAVAGVKARRDAEPDCRFIWAELLINVAPRDHSRAQQRRAENVRHGHLKPMTC